MLDQITRSHVIVGRVSRIPIGLNLSWFPVLGVVIWTLAFGYFPLVSPESSAAAVWTASVVGALVFFLCILAHELGHAWAAQGYGIEVNEITLFALGGVSRIAEEPERASQELWIAAAGPLVSLILAVTAALTGALVNLGPLAGALDVYLALVNAALFAFNLIPALPLDGGRILRALLWRVSGDAVRATRWSATAGRFAGVSLVSLGLLSGVMGALLYAFWFVMIGVFIERSARASGRLAAQAELAGGVGGAGGPPDWSPKGVNDLQVATVGLRTSTGGNVDAERRGSWASRIDSWRTRIRTLPAPAIPGDGERPDDPAGHTEATRYSDDRAEIDRLLGDAEAIARVDATEDGVDRKLRRVGELYARWAPAVSAHAPDRPEDSIAAGRPERFAPDPEEVLSREPGSSIEV